MKTERISTLDGFRALAILPVILFHFFSRWTPPLNQSDLYPYGSAYRDIPVFRYGYLGVEFFFVISGFVISMTLASSRDPWQFFAKRISRLWPAMLLCSTLTFLVTICIPHPQFAAHARNFVPSLLFIDPSIISKVAGRDFAWMDGAYWSLFVEVRFYFWAALIYFSARTRFLEVFFGLSTGILLLFLASDFYFPRIGVLVELLFFPAFLPWFTMGIGFFYLYTDKHARAFVHVAIIESLGVLVLQAWLKGDGGALPDSSIAIQFAVFAGIVAAFYAFIYKPQWLSVFAWRPISTLGAASYSLYLLHQYIGLTLLRYLTGLLGAPGEAVAAFVILLLVGMSILAYRYWEVPAKGIMLRVLLPARAATPPGIRGHLEAA